MMLEINNRQFEEMLKASMLYSWIYGGLADDNGDDFRKYEELEDYLVEKARENNLEHLTHKFKDSFLPSNELCKEIEDVIEEFENDSFWHSLMVEMGKRDFFRSATKDELKKLENDFRLPKRIDDIYDKYDEEFEKYGVKRLEIWENK